MGLKEKIIMGIYTTWPPIFIITILKKKGIMQTNRLVDFTLS